VRDPPAYLAPMLHACRGPRVAIPAAVALPAMAALTWPAGAPSGLALGVVAAVAILGTFAVLSLWRGMLERGQGFLVVAAILAAEGAIAAHPTEPEVGLLCGAGAFALVVHASGWLTPRRVELTLHHVQRVSTPAAVALLLVATGLRLADDAPWPSVVAAVCTVPAIGAIEADRRRGVLSAAVAGPAWVAASVAVLAPLLPGVRSEWAFAVAAPPLIATVFRRVDGRSLVEALFVSPARILVASFGAICVAGAALLAIGPSDPVDQPISLIDAAFTAVSATCVTGLAVRDTGGGFTGFGQLIILLLIQVGGLGIMTFAGAASVWTGRRMSLREEATAADLLGPEARADLEGALALALKVTLVTELVTALALLLAFLRQGDGLGVALWRAVFTAISAFCNAGFALQADSLVPYQDDPFVILPISAALIVGGLGPAVIASAPLVLRGSAPLHTQVVLTVTAILIVVPTVLYALLEWNASLDGLGPGSKVMNAWFQAVTPRTAGFNSVDLTEMRPPTWTLICALMFVGGSPGSTAGGIKTTTLAAIALSAVAAVRGREHTVVFGRQLPSATTMQALATTSAGIVSVGFGLMALQLTQAMPLDMVLFEVISALATVGLSIGGTAELDTVGKVIVMACMFAGRVGPLTVVVLLAESRAHREIARPEGKLLVG
jgi:trk system potassium uptake protein